MKKQLWVGFIAVYVVMQVLDYVINAMILEPTYQSLMSIWRPDMKVWLFPIIGLFVAFFFSLIFSKGYEGKGTGEGVRYGFYVGMLTSVPYAYGSYALYPIPYSLALQWFCYGMIEYIVLGVVVSTAFRAVSRQPAAS